MQITPPMRMFDGYYDYSTSRDNIWISPPQNPPSAGKTSHLEPSWVAVQDEAGRLSRAGEHRTVPGGSGGSANSSSSSSAGALREELLGLAQLRDGGLVTDAEHAALRARALAAYMNATLA
jgi:hypothetical protein